jgi:FolB domain-containing protein
MLGELMKEGGDCVHIEELEVFAHVGVPETERHTPQRLTVSISVWPHRQFEELQDDVANAVDYSKVCQETKRVVAEQSPKLIETLADKIAAHLLKAFAIQTVKVEVRKFVLTDAAYTSVIVTRSAKS